MPKQRRAMASRATAPASRAIAQRASRTIRQKPSRATANKTQKSRSKSAPRPAPAAIDRPIAIREAARKEPAAPPAPPRKPAFYEALAVYEAGVRALQRHDFETGAEAFLGVIDRYPGERELVERARLYLQVCERETARRPAPPPETATDSVYAATVALNAGDHEGALNHLGKALEEQPDSDHAHYIMAVALTDKGNRSAALDHLRQAISLNPENRATAIQDPDLSALRDLADFQEVLGTSIEGANRRRLRTRR
jgi:tetratricopeptide (TPR) repeat protein